MIRALWFFFRLALLTAALVWVAGRPGKIEVEWLGYLIETSVGFALACLLILFLAWTQAYRVWRAFVSVPQVYRRYKVAASREKGYRAVTAGMVAIAAGDGLSAEKYAKRAALMIPETPLVRLLTAQTHLLNGNAPRARREFSALLDDSDAAFLGLRGLLAEDLRDHNYADALLLMRRAETLQPKRAWVVRTLFDMETRNREWKKAEPVLKRAEKLSIFTANEARHRRQALYLAQSMESAALGMLKDARSFAEKSFALDPAFTPAALQLATLHNQLDKRRAALATIEKAWTAQPHPALAKMWLGFTPAAKKSLSIYDHGRDAYAWVRRLADLRPEHRESQKMLGIAALEARMWREAREHLKQAADFRQLALLERAESGSEAKAFEWLERQDGHFEDPQWTCAACGHAAASWTPLCTACGIFAHQEWLIPQEGAHRALLMENTAPLTGDILSPPRAAG